MTSEGYSEIVLDHFERPRNHGELEDANAVGYMTNPVCGDTLLLMLHVRDGRIEEARWQSDGCAASIAASSLLSELVQGRSLAEAESITREAVVEALGGLRTRSRTRSRTTGGGWRREARCGRREARSRMPETCRVRRPEGGHLIASVRGVA